MKYHIIALLPAIIHGYDGEFINLFSFSCMGYRNQDPMKDNRYLRMQVLPGMYSSRQPFTNFGTHVDKIKKYLKYLEKAFKV